MIRSLKPKTTNKHCTGTNVLRYFLKKLTNYILEISKCDFFTWRSIEVWRGRKCQPHIRKRHYSVSESPPTISFFTLKLLDHSLKISAEDTIEVWKIFNWNPISLQAFLPMLKIKNVMVNSATLKLRGERFPSILDSYLAGKSKYKWIFWLLKIDVQEGIKSRLLRINFKFDRLFPTLHTLILTQVF